jgi:CRP-like cAMP-binding protein
VQTVPGQEGEKLSPYQLFGEMAIIRDTPRRATVTARRPTTLLAIDKDTFRELTAQALGIASGFDEIIRRRLGLTDEG